VNVVSIGEVLWDVVGQTEHLGGAPFNFAAHLASLRHNVSFVSAVGADGRGQRILQRMAQMGLSTDFVSRIDGYPTGIVTVSLEGAGQPRYVIHRPAAYDFPKLSPRELTTIVSQCVDWIYFGTLLQMSSEARSLTIRLLDSAAGARRFYDVNLREGCWEPPLVRELMSTATIVKLNDEEVKDVAQAIGVSAGSLEAFCRSCVRMVGCEGVCITRGVCGCVLLLGGEYIEAEGYPVEVVDTVGAGDAFAAAFLHGLGSGWPASQIADFANRVGALIASRAGAIPTWTVSGAEALQHKSSPVERT
jgi:fructokinase